jgi:Polyketide cyclase / dehydrase and lipid transport
LAEVVEWVAVAARPETLLGLIRDYSQRHRFLPDGWRYLRPLSEVTSGIGAQIEIEARIGPAATTHVLQLHGEGDDFVDEGPPGGENYLTQWTVQARGEDDFEDGGYPQAYIKGPLESFSGAEAYAPNVSEAWRRMSIVQVEMQFSYGGFVGEFFARKRLRRALRDMLQRLKAIAEAR